MAILSITKLVRTAGYVEITVDGRKLGVVSDNATAEFDIPSGEHQLMAKLRWVGVTEFPFMATEESATSLTISDNQKLHLFPMIYLGFIVLYLNLYKEYGFWIPVYLLPIPIVLYYLYFFTLGSHKRMLVKRNG